jgi:hypothetical protein
MPLVKTTKISRTPAKGVQAAEKSVNAPKQVKAVPRAAEAGKGLQKDKVAERIHALI